MEYRWLLAATLLLFLLAFVRCQEQFVDEGVPDVETELTDGDFKLGKMMGEDPAARDDSGMYNNDLFEGDIADPYYASRRRRSLGRNAVRLEGQKWPGARIPITISKKYNKRGRGVIAQAVEEIVDKTCIRLVKRDESDEDYIHIAPLTGCYSVVGKAGGMQKLSLGNSCVHKGTIVHELMHAIGFFHEQSRADRDQYVTVHWENVDVGMQDQFEKYNLTQIDHLGTEYDYDSVMHYDPDAFTKNGEPTIVPKVEGVSLGHKNGLSENDAYKINVLYKCDPNRKR